MDATGLYTPIFPERVIEISQLYTIHYFENHRDWYFSGEKHDFWEIMYVDKGELIVGTDRQDTPVHFKQGELVFFRPMEFHRTYSYNTTGHNLLVMSFACHSSAMSFFLQNNHFSIDDNLRQLIRTLLVEAKKSYSSDSLVCPSLSVQRLQDADFGSEQILTTTLELLLIHLIRSDFSSEQENSRLASSYVDNAIFYMKQNLRKKITLDDICGHTKISRSQLQKAFRQEVGTSVMHYLSQLRMEESKFMICNGDKTFTEIAEEFGYSSVHHFSTKFRKVTGMSPSEYADSILSYTPHRIP